MGRLKRYTVELLSCEYKFDAIKGFGDFLGVEDKNLLWVIHADKIPPHIGVSADGHFYSLKANGKDEGVSVGVMMSLLDKKKIVCVLCELDTQMSSDDLSMVYDEYHNTIGNKTTCLDPIKKALDLSECEKLSELLQGLDELGKIKSFYGLNIPEGYKGIAYYTVSDIHEYLAKID